MAGFKTHITTSTVLGVGYGAAGAALGISLETCMLGAGLCSVAGMLPDLDSNSGRPIREATAFGAAVVPMLMLDRFQHMGLSNESIVLAGVLVYLVVRFGLAELLKRYSVHRGMWHSVPACAIAGLLAFLICSCSTMPPRYFKAGAVVLGFMSHLLLDEIYSIEWRGLWFRKKKSFGTAIKFFGPRILPNISVYAKLIILIAFCISDPIIMRHFGAEESDAHHTAISIENSAKQAVEEIAEGGQDLLNR